MEELSMLLLSWDPLLCSRDGFFFSHGIRFFVAVMASSSNDG